jgi:hypothetical protein
LVLLSSTVPYPSPYPDPQLTQGILGSAAKVQSFVFNKFFSTISTIISAFK